MCWEYWTRCWCNKQDGSKIGHRKKQTTLSEKCEGALGGFDFISPKRPSYSRTDWYLVRHIVVHASKSPTETLAISQLFLISYFYKYTVCRRKCRQSALWYKNNDTAHTPQKKNYKTLTSENASEVRRMVCTPHPAGSHHSHLRHHACGSKSRT